MNDLFALAISALLGGGLFKGIEAIYRAITDSKEKKTLSEILGVKTPAEVESVSVATMTNALESASTRITALEKERAEDKKVYDSRLIEAERRRLEDKKIYDDRLAEAEKRRLEEKNFYQGQIHELKDQVETFRAEIELMEQKLSDLLAATPRSEEEGQS